MSQMLKLFLLSSGFFAASTYGQQPPDNVSSDVYANTASGTSALSHLTPALGGSDNSAFGYEALILDTIGFSNTAAGFSALGLNTSGSQNTAVGASALSYNTTGMSNTAAGLQALFYNATGANNTAFGAFALLSNTSGKGNAAQGVNALYSNTTGIRNLGIGSNALYANTTGGYNIALGYDAGYNVTTGSNNIEIGASGTASDNNTIQIGVQGTQTATTIAGIYGSTITGSAVYVDSAGRLGVLASSERFKTDVHTMRNTEKLSGLRPVTFRLKTDPTGTLQYGLIAEEVAKVYPELVIRDAQGRIDGVRYEELAPMLLSEVQRLRRESARIGHLEQLVKEQQRKIADVDRLTQQVALLAQSNESTRRANVHLQAVIEQLAKLDDRLAMR